MPTPQIDPNTGEVVAAQGAVQIDPTTGEVASPPPAAQPPTLMQRMKNNFNANTQGAKSGDGWLKSAVEDFGAGGGDIIRMAAHPINTLTKMASTPDAGVDSIAAMAGNPEAQQRMSASAAGPHPGWARTLGQTGTGLMAGEVAGKVLGAGLEQAPKMAASIRTAAVGDPDAAALTGLRIPKSSNKVLPMQKSVQGARPYLQGASSLEDLQARIPAAKAEVWNPYSDAIDQLGDRPIKGPDGPTTAGDLEEERQQLSALNRGIKTGSPEALQLAQQKGMTAAQLLDREKAVTSALDPEIAKMGVDPLATRKAFGNISQVGSRVSGRSTLLEPKQNYGIAKLGDALTLKGVDITAPKTWVEPIKSLGSAGRDVAAGRYWRDNPTDVAIRDGFRGDSPKPSLATRPQRYLGAGSDELGRPYIPPYQTTPAPAGPRMALPASTSPGFEQWSQEFRSTFNKPPTPRDIEVYSETHPSPEAEPMVWEKRTPPPGFDEGSARMRVAPTQGEFNRMGGVSLPSQNRGLAIGSATPFRALPSTAGAGEAEPMIRMQAPKSYPSLADDFSRMRVEPNQFLAPDPIPSRGGVITPNGEVIQPPRMALPAKGSRARYGFPKSQ